jgi:hypothetical protein
MSLSRAFITTVYVITALVHLLPATGVLGARQLERLYQLQIDASQVELLLLMRHRAVLFSLVGFLLMYAAWRPELRSLAGGLGLVSMLSYCVLVLFSPALNGALIRVAVIDLVLSVALGIALMLELRATRA